ncbi:hypothetical protein Tco_0491031 [Tanacetum coccineum]
MHWQRFLCSIGREEMWEIRIKQYYEEIFAMKTDVKSQTFSYRALPILNITLPLTVCWIVNLGFVAIKARFGGNDANKEAQKGLTGSKHYDKYYVNENVLLTIDERNLSFLTIPVQASDMAEDMKFTHIWLDGITVYERYGFKAATYQEVKEYLLDYLRLKLEMVKEEKRNIEEKFVYPDNHARVEEPKKLRAIMLLQFIKIGCQMMRKKLSLSLR